MCQLKSFIEWNRIVFSKITKNNNIVLDMSMKKELIETEIFFEDT